MQNDVKSFTSEARGTAFETGGGSPPPETQAGAGLAAGPRPPPTPGPPPGPGSGVSRGSAHLGPRGPCPEQRLQMAGLGPGRSRERTHLLRDGVRRGAHGPRGLKPGSRLKPPKRTSRGPAASRLDPEGPQLRVLGSRRRSDRSLPSRAQARGGHICFPSAAGPRQILDYALRGARPLSRPWRGG